VVTNSIMELIKCGAIDCSKKNFNLGKVAYGFAVGTQELYDFVHHNDFLQAFPVLYLNNPAVIAKNDNLFSVNNALMVDLTGQVGSETLGTKQYSATGGQVNFVLGAQAL
jgi:4-hydroxybutyrate CoA-transferase